MVKPPHQQKPLLTGVTVQPGVGLLHLHSEIIVSTRRKRLENVRLVELNADNTTSKCCCRCESCDVLRQVMQQ